MCQVEGQPLTETNDDRSCHSDVCVPFPTIVRPPLSLSVFVPSKSVSVSLGLSVWPRRCMAGCGMFLLIQIEMPSNFVPRNYTRACAHRQRARARVCGGGGGGG